MAEEQNKKPIPLTLFLILTTIITCLGSSMLYGYNISVLNLPGEHIQCFFRSTLLNYPCYPYNTTKITTKTLDMNIDAKSKFLYSISNVCFMIGGMIGAFSTGFVANLVGRRNGLILNHIFIIIGGSMIIPTVRFLNPWIFFVGRFFVGINCGVTVGLASIYLTEIAPTELRGAIGACHQLAVTIGIAIGNLFTMRFALGGVYWSVAAGIDFVPAIISLFTLPFMPESYCYLYRKNKKDEARLSFKKLNISMDADVYFNELDKEIELTKNEPDFKFSDLFTRTDLRIPLIIACLMQIMQQLSGINAVMTYSGEMLKSARINNDYLEVCVLCLSIFNVLCTIISLPLLERLGRRTLLIYPSALMCFALLILTVTVSISVKSTGNLQTTMAIISLIFIFIYIFGFALGLGTVTALIVSEIFLQGPRGAAYSVSQAIQWTCALIVLLIYPNMNQAIQGFSFLPFFVIAVICLIFFWFYMPETKNRTFEEIAKDLAIGKPTASVQEQPNNPIA